MSEIVFAAPHANFGEGMYPVRDAESPSEASASASVNLTNAQTVEWSSSTASALTAAAD